MTCALCGSSQHTAPNCKWLNTCASCIHMDLRASTMGVLGLAKCKADRRPYAFKSPTTPRECAKSAPADVEVVSKRAEYFDKQRGVTA